jgi:hypothetical protein
MEGGPIIDDNSLDYPDSFQDASGRLHVLWRSPAINPPAGVSAAAACNGKLRLKITKQLKRGKCRFGKTVYIKRSKVGSATRLRLKVRFKGNSVLRAGRTTKTLVIKQ